MHLIQLSWFNSVLNNIPANIKLVLKPGNIKIIIENPQLYFALSMQLSEKFKHYVIIRYFERSPLSES